MFTVEIRPPTMMSANQIRSAVRLLRATIAEAKLSRDEAELLLGFFSESPGTAAALTQGFLETAAMQNNQHQRSSHQ